MPGSRRGVALLLVTWLMWTMTNRGYALQVSIAPLVIGALIAGYVWAN
jgi:hypothetical protein